MFSQRQTNPIQQSLLRSALSEEEVISTKQYEENKQKLYQWLKIIAFLLFLFLLAVLGVKIVQATSSMKICSTLKSFFLAPFHWFSSPLQEEKNCEIVKYVTHTDKQLEELQKLKAYRRKLGIAGFSIKSLLPQTPNLDYIKNHPENFDNLTVIKQKLINEELPPQSQLENLMTDFNNLIPYGFIDLKSSQQDQNLIKEQLTNDIRNQEDAIKRIDDEFIENLRFNIEDLNQSQKNYLIKRQKVNIFREQFLNIMKQLQDCQNQLRKYQNTYDSKNKDYLILLDQQNDLKDKINGLQQSFDELQQTLNDLNSQKEKDLAEIRAQFNKYQFQVDNQAQIQIQIKKDQDSIQNLKDSQPSIMNQIDKLIEQKQFKDKEFENLETEIKKLDLQAELFEDKIKLHTEELDAAYKNEKLNNYVINMVNKDAKIGYLAKLMTKKVENERHLLNNVEFFRKKMEEIEGEWVVDFMKGSSVSEIMQIIEQDKQDFQNISSNYQDLLKKINNLKDIKAEINRLVLLRKRTQDDFDKIKNSQRELRKNLDQLRNEIIKIEQQIKRLEDQYDLNKKLIITREKEVQNKIDNLEQALRKYQKIKNKLEEREKFFDDQIKQEKEHIKNIQAEIQALKKQLKILQDKISVLIPELKQLKEQYETQEKDCSAYILYFYETEKFAKDLKEKELKDKQILSNLKTKIIDSLNVIKDI